MHPLFGDTTPAPQTLQHSTRITFRAEHLKLKWSHCNSTADFLSAFYAGILTAGRTAAQISDISHSISYLVNELVENAVKFHTVGNVDIEAGLDGEDFVFRIGNWITPETAGKFQKLLHEITAGDPGEMLIKRIEANAAGAGGSGLGLLTLMSDYGARLTFSFEPGSSPKEPTHTETLARLRLPQASGPTFSKIRHGN
jgi:hypothetical protein